MSYWLACLPHTVCCGFVPDCAIPKTIIKNFLSFLLDTHALEYQFDSEARRFERLGNVWNCLRGHAQRSGINRESRVLYPSPGFLSSATCPSLSKNAL